MHHGRRPIPDPDEEPEAFKDAEKLEYLYVERGWRRKDIAEHFEITDAAVRKWLSQHDIEREVEKSHVPTNGLARELWEIGKAEAVK